MPEESREQQKTAEGSRGQQRTAVVVVEGGIWNPGYGDTALIPVSSRAHLRKAESGDSSPAAPCILMSLTPVSGLLSLARGLPVDCLVEKGVPR